MLQINAKEEYTRLLSLVSNLIRIPFYLWDKNYESKHIKSLLNIHKDRERCFIIGNGPSIRNQDLSKLKDEIVFVSNWFVLHEQYEIVNPEYYCVSDPHVFEKDNIDNFLGLLSDKTLYAKYFFPLRVKNRVKRFKPLKDYYVMYINYVAYPIWELNKINLDISSGLYSGDTIIIDFCLPLAYYMGFKQIYLIGCDCTLGKIVSRGGNKHFYDESKHITQQQTNDYLQNKWLQRVITSYKVAKQAFEINERKIYNAGHDGELEVFERVNYDDLF